MNDDTLDLDEAAAYLKVHRATMQQLAASGEIPGAQIGRSWVFLRDDLREYLRQQVRIQQADRKSRTTHPDGLRPDPIAAPPKGRSSGRRRNPTPALPDLAHFAG